MDFELHDFRHAGPLLRDRPVWTSLRTAIEAIDQHAIVSAQRDIVHSGQRAPKGGQTVINGLFKRHLSRDEGWLPEPRLFRDPLLKEWKMDFLRDRVGVEVSFNHAEAIAWQFTRLNIAGESDRVLDGSRIDVGVVITATRSLKVWARMDSAVGTFDAFHAWLREMKPILPIPILLVGLRADGWDATDAFAGTGRRTDVAALPPAAVTAMD